MGNGCWAGNRGLAGLDLEWLAIDSWQSGALRNLLPFVWILVYFGWLGKLWVMTMRYYLPLYPIFAVLAAWALLEIAASSFSFAGRMAQISGFCFGSGCDRFYATLGSHVHQYLSSFVYPGAVQPIGSLKTSRQIFRWQVEGTDSPLINIAIQNRTACWL